MRRELDPGVNGQTKMRKVIHAENRNEKNTLSYNNNGRNGSCLTWLATSLEEKRRWSGVAEWSRALTGDRTVNGSSPAAVKTFLFASELWQFRLPRLASVFRMRH